ncbi:MAG TPA: hypothetical protein VK524_15935 [Polyangiaceae bacterium]|nr:hypothetical protein [Polyangiaceae bacterium]
MGGQYFAGSVPQPARIGGDGVHRSDGQSFGDGGGFTCKGCHTLAPQDGHFGTDGQRSVEGLTQIFKVAHLRNLYQKVGMFGRPRISGTDTNNAHQGNQIRGFGFLHDGSVDSVFRFLSASTFAAPTSTPDDDTRGFRNDQERRDVEAFMLAFDNDLAPVVGQQVTLTSQNAAQVGPRISLLIARALTSFTSKILGGATTECELITSGGGGTARRGAWLQPSGLFMTDDAQDPLITDTYIRQLAQTAGQEVTYTCVPPGSGRRMGIDRDLDTVLNHDDNCPNKANTNQQDADVDGIGDACDDAYDGMQVLRGAQGAVAASAPSISEHADDSGGCGVSPLQSLRGTPLWLFGMIGGAGFWLRRRNTRR